MITEELEIWQAGGVERINLIIFHHLGVLGFWGFGV
jgi:hypothetical protein